MAFRSDTAAATLSSVLDELARTWERDVTANCERRWML